MREVKEKLGARAMWREIAGTKGCYELREPAATYEPVFWPENAGLRAENAFFWETSL